MTAVTRQKVAMAPCTLYPPMTQAGMCTQNRHAWVMLSTHGAQGNSCSGPNTTTRSLSTHSQVADQHQNAQSSERMKSVTCMKQWEEKGAPRSPPSTVNRKAGSKANSRAPPCAAHKSDSMRSISHGHICSSEHADSSRRQQQRERGQIIATLPHGVDFTKLVAQEALSHDQQAPRLLRGTQDTHWLSWPY